MTASAKALAQRFVLAAKDPKDDFREQNTGRYMHTKWTRLCKNCGHPVGQHSGEKTHGMRPCFHEDLYSDGCACPVFVSSPKFMSDEDYERYEKGKFTPEELKGLKANAKSERELETLHENLEKEFWEKTPLKKRC